jgi:hypothetical protein
MAQHQVEMEQNRLKALIDESEGTKVQPVVVVRPSFKPRGTYVLPLLFFPLPASFVVCHFLFILSLYIHKIYVRWPLHL